MSTIIYWVNLFTFCFMGIGIVMACISVIESAKNLRKISKQLTIITHLLIKGDK